MRIIYKRHSIKNKKHKNIISKTILPRIIGITVSVDFNDYLLETLFINKQFLDDFYVVTSKDDKKTQKLCKKNKIKFLTIERTKPKFLKGVYINYAFDSIPHKDWFLLLDADTVLTSQIRNQINKTDLKKHCLYGVSQKYCDSYKEWLDYKKNGKECDHWWIRNTCGMGCFQLFHSSNLDKKGPIYWKTKRGRRIKKKIRYEQFSVGILKEFSETKYKGSDYFFNNRFWCVKYLSSCYVIHLKNNFNFCTNIDGRVTKLFQQYDD